MLRIYSFRLFVIIAILFSISSMPVLGKTPNIEAISEIGGLGTDLHKYKIAIDSYYDAIRYYNQGNYDIGLIYINKSVDSWDQAGYGVKYILSPTLGSIGPSDSWNLKGIILNKLGRYEEAINCFDVALYINPEDCYAWANKGDALYNLGDYEKAIECYDNANTTDPSYAFSTEFTPYDASLKDYAKLSFALPSEVVVEPESIFEDNYTEGIYVGASLRLNESKVYILLLYPCHVPETQLDALGLKSAIEGFNVGLNQTIYSPTPLNISDRPAIWGKIGNQILVAYQPSDQTVSMVFIDENMTESTVEYLLGTIQINVSESNSPLWLGYCSTKETAVAPSSDSQTGSGTP